MLAVPVQRSIILLAKFIVVAVWSAALFHSDLDRRAGMGALIQLPGGSLSVILQGSALVAATACLTIAVILPFAVLCQRGARLPAADGVAMLTLNRDQYSRISRVGRYFPWAVPGLFAQAKSPLTQASYGSY